MNCQRFYCQNRLPCPTLLALLLLPLIVQCTEGQALQNGVWITINAPGTFVPSFVVPAGQGTLKVEIANVRQFTVIDNISSDGSQSELTVTTDGSLPTPQHYRYHAYILASQNSWSIANPPAANYLLRLFSTSPALYVGSYQIRASYYPAAPVITAQPQSVAACVGEAANFGVSASGQNLTYQWFKGVAALGGENGPGLRIEDAQLGNAGTYYLQVSNAGGSVNSASVTLSVGERPNITTQPQSQSIVQGRSVTFTVPATGSNLKYQWLKGGSIISGATSASYNISLVQQSDGGMYSVSVSNDCGSQNSSGATLTVLVVPIITLQPRDVDVRAGESATFSVIASGTSSATFSLTAAGSALSYQWFFDNVLMAGQTAATLTINNAQQGNVGNYSVKVSNGAGSTTSRSARLTLLTAPVITAWPQSQMVAEGEDVSMSVSASGALPLSYQWNFQGSGSNIYEPLSGGSSPTLSLSSVTAVTAGNYTVTVQNYLGSAITTPARITVMPEPKIVKQPQSKAVPPGTNVTFTVKAFGRLPLSYQWYVGAQAIAGATEASLSLANVTLEQSGGLYTVLVSNSAAGVRSDPAHLTVSAAFADLGSKVWSLDLPTKEPPAFDSDGTLYLTSSTNAFAISPLGKTNWSMSSRMFRALGPEGEAYLIKPRSGADAERTRLSLLSSTGNLLWSYHLRDATDFLASHADIEEIALRSDGVLACYGSTIGFSLKRNALYSGGNLISESFEVKRFPKPYQALGKSFGFVGEDDTAYVVYRSGQTLVLGYMTAINPDGSPYWTIHFEIGHPALNSRGEIVFEKSFAGATYLGASSYISCYSSSGIKRWERIGSGRSAIAPEDKIVIGSNGKLICLNPDGSPRWETAPDDIEAADPVSTPAIAADGTIYFAARFSLYAYDSHGALLWQYPTREPILSAPTIGEDGIVYFSTNKRLYAIKGSAPLAASSWPVEGANPRRTFRGTRAPAFTAVPPDVSAIVSQTVILETKAEGTPPIEFQWRFKGTNLPGGKEGTLVLKNLTLQDSGAYEVDAVNPETGLLMRTNVQVTVSTLTGPMLRAEQVRRQEDGSTRLTFAVPLGIRVVVEASIDLKQWEEIHNSTSSQTPVVIEDGSAKGKFARFYRISLTL
jgi:hypothetical protein